MQLGKKSKTTDMFERVRGDLGTEAEESAPLVSNTQPTTTSQKPVSARNSTSLDRDAIHITVAEKISAKLSREGTLKSFSVKGDLQLRISDPSFTKVRLDLTANPNHGTQFRPHPNVDRALFTNSKTIQLRDTSRGFPANNPVGVLRWSSDHTSESADILPITFTVWVNKGADESWTITVEYELTGGDSLRDVAVIIPYATSEPAVSSFDAMYEVTGDSLEWTIGPVDEANPSGSFEFEAQAEDEAEFFPMKVKFSKTKPFADVDVSLYLDSHFEVSTDTMWRTGLISHIARDGSRYLIHERDQVCSGLLYNRIKPHTENKNIRFHVISASRCS